MPEGFGRFTSVESMEAKLKEKVIALNEAISNFGKKQEQSPSQNEQNNKRPRIECQGFDLIDGIFLKDTL